MTPTQIGSGLGLDKRTTQRRIEDLRETLGAETTVAAVVTTIRIGLIERVPHRN